MGALRRLVGLFVLLLVWEVSARLFIKSVFFPPITKIAPALFSLIYSGEAIKHAIPSLWRITLGFCLAAVVGITLGVAITQSRTLDTVLGPVIDAVRPVAALTIFPLLILLLGLGDASKVAVIFWTAWPAVLLNTAEGIRRVDYSVKEAAQLDGANRWQLLRHISFILALPAIVTGLRIGMSGGWISLVSAEMLGSSRGLGYSILAYSQTFRFVEMYATVILIALLGLGMNILLAFAQDTVDYKLQGGQNDGYKSPFIRYLDRAASFGIDSGKLRFWKA
jgi:NitT/TauT family transport system permease protein